MPQAIGEVSRGEFCETGEAVCDAFDCAKPGWTCSNRCQESRQHRRCDFVAPIAEETGQPDAEDGAVEPGLLLSRSRHRGSSLQATANR